MAYGSMAAWHQRRNRQKWRINRSRIAAAGENISKRKYQRNIEGKIINEMAYIAYRSMKSGVNEGINNGSK